LKERPDYRDSGGGWISWFFRGRVFDKLAVKCLGRRDDASDHYNQQFSAWVTGGQPDSGNVYTGAMRGNVVLGIAARDGFD